MFTLELSTYELQIPNEAYTSLSQNLIGCSTPSQDYCKLIGYFSKTTRWVLITFTCPFLCFPDSSVWQVYIYYCTVVCQIVVYIGILAHVMRLCLADNIFPVCQHFATIRLFVYNTAKCHNSIYRILHE